MPLLDDLECNTSKAVVSPNRLSHLDYQFVFFPWYEFEPISEAAFIFAFVARCMWLNIHRQVGTTNLKEPCARMKMTYLMLTYFF